MHPGILVPLTTPNTIRILGILPVEENFQIVTKLRAISVDDTELQYDALSYTWDRSKIQKRLYAMTGL
jgi:hypothetical protein